MSEFNLEKHKEKSRIDLLYRRIKCGIPTSVLAFSLGITEDELRDMEMGKEEWPHDEFLSTVAVCRFTECLEKKEFFVTNTETRFQVEHSNLVDCDP